MWGILIDFNVPLDTVQVISETVATQADTDSTQYNTVQYCTIQYSARE